MWSWHTPTSEPALTLAAAAPRSALHWPLHHLRNLGLPFVPSESLRVGAPLVLPGEVGFCLPSPLSTRQQNLWWPHHAEQCGKLRPTLVPGRTHWASAESVSAGAEGRGGRRSREGRFVPWHSSIALPLSGSAPPGPLAAVLGPALTPGLLLSPFLGPHLSCGPANLSP